MKTTVCVRARVRGMQVPGELLTDLQNAGKVKDPLSSNNHKDPSQVAWWNGDVYTYQKNFTFGMTAQASAR